MDIAATAAPANALPERAPRRRAYRRQMLLLIAASYGVDTITLFLYWLAGATSLFTPIGYGTAGLIHSAVFLAVSETHINDRFDDHYLTVPSSLVSAAIQLVFLALCPEVGFVFLSILFIIFGFSSLRLTSRQAAIGWGVTALGLGAVLLLTDHNIIVPSATRYERIITLFFFVLTLGRCVFLGLYGSSLRELLYKRSEQLREASKKIEELARIDELTGAFSRRSIMTALNDELARASRNATPLSVVLLDLDWFKSINDRFGHPAGDEVLRTFAITAAANMRSVDKLGRYGGEEFLVILPDTPQRAAATLMDRILKTVARLDWSAIAPNTTVTVSAGVAEFREHDTMETILARADSALYGSKAAGRNRVSVA